MTNAEVGHAFIGQCWWLLGEDGRYRANIALDMKTDIRHPLTHPGFDTKLEALADILHQLAYTFVPPKEVA